MTLREQTKLLGPAFWNTGGDMPLALPVEVTDVRIAFGQVRVLIAPVGGHGTRWVSRDNVAYAGNTKGSE
jgi:hypothetical protein